MALEDAQKIFKPCETMPDIMLCLSHKKRLTLNHAVNVHFANNKKLEGKATKLIPKTTSKSLGVPLEPQDYIIWEGMELLGCIRMSNSKTVINGVWYVVLRWDESSVYLKVHPRYQKQPEETVEKPVKEEDEDEDDEEDPAEGEVPEELKLSHENTSKWLRPMHALCYGSIQGCTMEDKRILLLDTRAKEGRPRHFTLRHLIVGVSRATHQDLVHVATEAYEKDLMLHAGNYGANPMRTGGDTFKYTDADFESDDNDLALYFNDPDEVPVASSLLSIMNVVATAPVAISAAADVDINQYFDHEGNFEEVDSDSDMDMDM